MNTLKLVRNLIRTASALVQAGPEEVPRAKPRKLTGKEWAAFKSYAEPLGFYCTDIDGFRVAIFLNSKRDEKKQMSRDDVREKLINRKIGSKFPDLAFFNKGSSPDSRKDYVFHVYARPSPNVVFDAELQ